MATAKKNTDAVKKNVETAKKAAEAVKKVPRRDTALTKRAIAEMLERKYALELEQASMIVQSILNMMMDSLKKGGHIEFRDFGVFEVVERKERLGRNPRKPKETVIIPMRRTVRFKPGKMMKFVVGKNRTGTQS